MSLESISNRVIAFGMPLLEKVSHWRRWAIHPVFWGSVMACASIGIYWKVQSNWKKAQEAKLKFEEEQKYQKARDTLIVWKTIALEIHQSTIASELKEALKTKELVLTKISQFGRWLQENNSSLQQIRAIRFESESITSLPDEIEKLTNLEQLYLQENRFTTLPPVISRLAKLQVLSLNNNQLKNLPDSIGDLQNLKHLTLNHNKIEVLPDSFRKLSKLEWLSIDNNKLSILPDWIGEVAQLKRLFLNDNQLTSLPTTLSQLTKLERIDIKNNKFTARPEVITQLNADIYVVES